MPSKRTVLIVLLVAVLALAPAASSGGGWRLIEERLGLVETDIAIVKNDIAANTQADSDLAERIGALEERAIHQEFLITSLRGRLLCLEMKVYEKKTCRWAARPRLR